MSVRPEDPAKLPRQLRRRQVWTTHATNSQHTEDQELEKFAPGGGAVTGMTSPATPTKAAPSYRRGGRASGARARISFNKRGVSPRDGRGYPWIRKRGEMVRYPKVVVSRAFYSRDSHLRLASSHASRTEGLGACIVWRFFFFSGRRTILLIYGSEVCRSHHPADEI